MPIDKEHRPTWNRKKKLMFVIVVICATASVMLGFLAEITRSNLLTGLAAVAFLMPPMLALISLPLIRGGDKTQEKTQQAMV